MLGFKALEWADPNWQGKDPIPHDWAVTASFVSDAALGLGAGRVLFMETLRAAKKANVKTINATIRADNVPGLGFYGSIGFLDYGTESNAALSDGSFVDRIHKRYDL